MSSTALARIAVGVLVERRAARSAWADLLWRPITVLPGEPSAEAWTVLSAAGDTTLFYAGSAIIDLYRTETSSYRDNLASGEPRLWVALRPVRSGLPYELFAVTADPAEGEAFTEAGTNLVETVPMPHEIVATVREFIVRHHVERPFQKRRRQPADPALAACSKGRGAGL